VFLTSLYLQVAVLFIIQFANFGTCIPQLKLVASYSGICNELINIQRREYICSKPHLVISEEDHPDNTTITPPINQVADEPITDAPEIAVDEPITDAPEIVVDEPITDAPEIERIVSVADDQPATIPTQSKDTEQIIPSAYRSPNKGGVATPTSVSEGMEIPYGATSPRAHASETGTPSTYHDNIFQSHDFSDTNQFISSAGKDVRFNVSS
jgi:hypothetical protein